MENLPAHNSEYELKQYWDTRYSDDKDTFDWFLSLNQCPILTSLMQPSHSIIHLGCGNSTLPIDLYNIGYHSITNIDYSPLVISQMKERCAHMPLMTWLEGDIYDLEACIQSIGTFDIALDKGTLDALLVSKFDPWDPEQEILDKVAIYMKQVYKQLKPGGSFLHITFVQPHFRKRFLELVPEFVITVHTLDSEKGGFDYYCYQATKPL